jgi:hypothetical protein
MSPARASSLSTLPVRGAVGFAGVAAFAWAVAIYALGRVPLDPGFFPALALLVAGGMITRRYGIPLPGNGFASYVLGVMIIAVLLRGSAFGVLVAPGAMLGGDLLLRRLPWRAAAPTPRISPWVPHSSAWGTRRSGARPARGRSVRPTCGHCSPCWCFSPSS